MTSKTTAPKVPVALPKKDDSATPATASPPLLAPEEALKTAIGSKLRVTIVPPYSDHPLEGYLHTADAAFNWLILWNPTPSNPTPAAVPRPTSPLPPSGSVKVIMFNQIQSFQILSLPTPSTSLSSESSSPMTEISPSTISTSLGNLRLEKAIRAEQDKLARRGPKGTSPSEQALFEALARTMPARWEGSKMVISDHYVIDKPYGAGNVGLVSAEGGKGGQGLDRIKRIVDMERSKIALKMGGDVTGGAGIGAGGSPGKVPGVKKGG